MECLEFKEFMVACAKEKLLWYSTIKFLVKEREGKVGVMKMERELILLNLFFSFH